MYPSVEFQVVADYRETRTYVDRSTGASRSFEARTITGIVSGGAVVSVSVPERVSPRISVAVGDLARIFCSKIEVVSGIWHCVAQA